MTAALKLNSEFESAYWEELSIEHLKPGIVTDCDLYLPLKLKKSGNPQEPNLECVLYAPAPYFWEEREINRLKEDGHRILYFKQQDREKINSLILLNSIVLPSQNLSPKQQLTELQNAAAELTRVLFRHAPNETIFYTGETIANRMIECIQEDVTCITVIEKLQSYDLYTFYHSARVSAYALAIAVKIGVTDQATLQDIAIGCLFHDIGKSKVPIDLLNKPDALTPEQWNMMRQHPVFGHQMVDASHMPLTPREIILHHHERMDGKGYPHGLVESEIMEEVKIASFADVFDALTSTRPYQKSRTKYEALDFIKHRLLKGLHKDSFLAFVEILKDNPDSK